MITEWITLSKSWVRDLSPQGSWDQRARHCFRAPQMQEHGEVRQGLSGTEQANYTLARHTACQIRGNLPAPDFRFTLTSCWCPQMDLAEISKVRPFTPFQLNGVKLWKQFELQNKTCCVLCNILLLFDTEMSTFFYYYYFFLWIDSRSSSTCWLFR